MPRVSADLSAKGTEGRLYVMTSEFQSGTASSGGLPIFRTCQASNDTDCCVYGGRECSVLLLLNLRRVDGEPFPPVDVTSQVGAAVDVSSCPLGGEVTAKLTLEEAR